MGKNFFLQEEIFFFCEHPFYCFWSYWCLRVKYHMFLFFQKFFFTKSWKFLCDYVIFSPKHAIFFIFYILNIRLFWRKYFGHENRKKTIEIPFIILSISTPCRQANTNIDSPLQARSPRRGPSRVANQSLEVRCSSIIFPPNPKMVYLVLGGSTPIENPS